MLLWAYRGSFPILADKPDRIADQVIPALGLHAIPPAFLRAIVEKTLWFTRGVYGLVNTGSISGGAREGGNEQPLPGVSMAVTSRLVRTEVNLALYGQKSAMATFTSGSAARLRVSPFVKWRTCK
jgi:hypothetical protein